jgi:hypothetical protein
MWSYLYMDFSSVWKLRAGATWDFIPEILRCQCHPQDDECQQRIINLNSICTLFIYRTVNDKMTFHSVSFEFIACF